MSLSGFTGGEPRNWRDSGLVLMKMSRFGAQIFTMIAKKSREEGRFFPGV